MQKIKKMLALILCVAMCASFLIPMSAAADGFSDVTSDHKYYSAINLLASMGIINGFDDGTFKPDDTVTRAQYAKIMAYALKVGDITATTQQFTDVAVDHWAAGNISAMVAQGIVNGMGDGTFAPESPVLYEQAVKMTVCALGYDSVAKNNGGYPDGYLTVANNRGFVKGISDGVVEQPANRGLIAKLVSNMMDIDVLDPVTGEVKKDSSLNKDVYSANTINGQIVAVYNAGLTSSLETACKKNEVIIETSKGQTTYTTDGLSDSVKNNIKNYLGKKVKVRYTDDDSAEELNLTSMLEQKNKNEIVNIDASDINDYESNTIKYYDDESEDIVSISVASDAYVIYNGRTTSKSVKSIIEALMNQSGSISLLSPGNDGTYSVIFVTSYTTLISGMPSTDSADDKKLMIVDKNNISTVRFSVPKESSTKQTVTYTLNGAAGTYSSVTTDSIVSIAISDDESIIDVKVSTTKKTGASVTSLSTDDMQLALDGTTYDYSDIFKKYMEDNVGIVAVGIKGDFSLDAFGKIAAVKISATSYTYGYLTDIEAAGSSSMDSDGVLLNIYPVTTGTTLTSATYGFKENFSLNGAKYKSNDSDTIMKIFADEANAFVTENADGKTVLKGSSPEIETKNHGYSQLVKFSVSGTTSKGYKAIDKIFTASGAEVNNTTLVNSALVRNTPAEDAAAGANCVNSLKSVVASGSARSLGEFTTSSSTKIIEVPIDKANDKFFARTQSYLTTGTTFNVQIFDASSGNVTPIIVVYASKAGSNVSLTYQNTPFIVSEVGSTRTVDGEETDVIKVVNGTNKAETEFYIGDDTQLVKLNAASTAYETDTEKTVKDLVVGDIIRFTYDDAKYLNDVELTVSRDNVGPGIRGISTASAVQNVTNNRDIAYRHLIGTAKSWGDSSMLVFNRAFVSDGTLSEEGTESLNLAATGIAYYVVDKNQTDKKKILVDGSMSDVLDYKSVGESASKMFVFMTYSNVKFVVVFK